MAGPDGLTGAQGPPILSVLPCLTLPRLSSEPMLPIFRRIALLALPVVLVACQDKLVDNTDSGDPVTDVSFSTEVQPIFNASCSGVGCHIGQTTNGVNLSSYAQVTASTGTQYGSKIVVPGDADASPIVDKLRTNPDYGVRMPRGGAALSAAKIQLIRTWIDEGALDN